MRAGKLAAMAALMAAVAHSPASGVDRGFDPGVEPQQAAPSTSPMLAIAGGSMHPFGLNEIAARRRRAQQGKRGKRWRGGRA